MIPRPTAYVLAVAVFGAAIASVYALGRKSAEADITIENEEAGNAADRASSVFERCIDAGGVFDFATGECRRH